jgi:hypothetical protein
MSEVTQPGLKPVSLEVSNCFPICPVCGRLRVGKSFFTLQGWSVQPCVRPVSAVHMTAGHNTRTGREKQLFFEVPLIQISAPQASREVLKPTQNLAFFPIPNIRFKRLFEFLNLIQISARTPESTEPFGPA